jgi:hypothetical protein
VQLVEPDIKRFRSVFNHLEYALAIFKLNAVITNSFLSGIGMHSTLFERNIVSSFSACPEYSLANVEHLLARKQSGNHQIT